MIQEKVSSKSTIEQFKESAKYADLKKEVTDSMASIDVTEIGESDRDIAPVLNYFEEEAINGGLSEVQAEKLFWQTVFEELKETRIRDIYYIIRPDIENKDYAVALRVMTEEFDKIIKQLSHTIFSNLSRKSVALTILKEKFYGLFPEIEALIEGTEENKMAKAKRPAGEYGLTAKKHLEEQFYEDEEDAKWEKEKGKYLVKELEWPVPKGSELVPGLVIALSDQEAKRMEDIEFLEYPHFEDGDLFVKVKWNGEEGNIKLFNFGLVADAETGLWNSRYKPLLWEIKEKK